MNTYRIQYKVKTLILLCFPEIIIDWYKITNRLFNMEDWPQGDARIVEREIDSESFIDALSIFRREFNIIIQRLSFTSQCYISFLDQSFLIQRINGNIEKVFYLSQISEHAPCWLYFMQQELDNYNKTKDLFEDSPFLMYMQESCNNALGYYAKLSLLCSGLEALAWKEEKQWEKWSYRTYNTKVMKKILGNECYGKVFWANWLRHKIQHWDFMTDFKWDNYVDLIYNKIIEYCNIVYGLKLDIDIISPQRHFYWNLESIKCFLRPKDLKYTIDLRDIDEDIIESLKKEECPFMYENISSNWY